MKSASKIIFILLFLALICFYAIPVLADTTDSNTNTIPQTKINQWYYRHAATRFRMGWIAQQLGVKFSDRLNKSS